MLCKGVLVAAAASALLASPPNILAAAHNRLQESLSEILTPNGVTIYGTGTEHPALIELLKEFSPL